MQVAVLDALAQLGCDPSVKDSVSSTPMHVAAGEGHIQAILKLIELVRGRYMACKSALSQYSSHGAQAQACIELHLQCLCTQTLMLSVDAHHMS